MSAVEVERVGGSAKLTQKQIADQLGVSRQLVSFALRGQGRMSDALRRQILEVAKDNGYHQYSNREARAMIARRYGKRAASGIMAVLFRPTFQNQPLSSVPFFMPFFEGLESEAIRHGIDLALCAVRPNELPRLVRENQVDGVIGLLIPENTIEQMRQTDLPLVSVLYEVESGVSLMIDDARGTQLATEHLIRLGHRNIAYIGLHYARGKEREQGYRKALREHHLAQHENLIDISDENPSIEGGAAAMQRLMAVQPPKFSGLVCHNDLMAIGAISVLKEHGCRVPEDVSVVGFDDVSRHYSFSPALTSINFQRQEVGQRAVQLLCQQQAEGATAANFMGREVFPVRLVERDSTRPYSGA